MRPLGVQLQQPRSRLADQVMQPPRPLGDQPSAPQPRHPGLTTGPIQWDEESIKGAQAQLPQRQLLNAILMLHPMGGMLRALRSPLLRDMKLERMFRR